MLETLERTEHTLGPWEPWDATSIGTPTTGTPKSVAHIANTESGDIAIAEQAANRDRIVACVNACAGINPEAVPDLIEAAIDLVSDCQNQGYGPPSRARLSAAVAKAEANP